MLSEKEMDVMEHCLGVAEHMLRKRMKYKRHNKTYVKSYRNYFQTEPGCDSYNVWKQLVDKNYAITWGKDYVYFQVTNVGVEQLEKQQNYIIKFV